MIKGVAWVDQTRFCNDLTFEHLLDGLLRLLYPGFNQECQNFDAYTNNETLTYIIVINQSNSIILIVE